MLNRKRFAFLILSVTLPVFGREGTPPLSRQRAVQPLATVQQLVLPPTDAPAELAADAKEGSGTPLRYAVPSSLTITPATHGTWEQLPTGRLWRLRVVSAGATDLNFGFTTFWLPEGATLHLCAEGEAYFQGPYTARDNKPHGQLWTPVLPGGSAFIELFVPAPAKEEPRLVLSQVARGYRDMFRRRKDLSIPKAGSCEIDVVCPQGAAWSNEVRSVARYTISGKTLCSGTLIADVAGDFRNYFLTANHCGLDAVTAASVVVYWNYQSPVCGELGGGSLAQNQSGAIFRAAKADVDFSLIELDDIPDNSFNVYYSGWDRSGATPAGAVGIHHPNGDEKAISFSTTALTTINSCIGTGGSGTHWQVFWSQGVTEPGSSGSGIWNPSTHRLVGTLSGGSSDCSHPTLPDCYGKFSVSWASGTSNDTRLSDWLDPQNTGVANVAGIDPFLRAMPSAAGSFLMTEGCSPTNNAIDPGETVGVSFALRNMGRVNATNLVATLQALNGVTLPSGAQSYGLLAAGGAALSRTFSFTANGDCGGTIAPVLQLQSGTNNLGTVVFSLPLGHPNAALSQTFDGVLAPALPAGWTASLSGTGSAWAASSAQSDTSPNAVFAADPPAISDNRLNSPPISITSSNAQLTFRHSYDLETGSAAFDGGVLEISMNGGAFMDIVSAGGVFVTNGYTSTLSSNHQNPLGGRAAWSGNSGGFVTTTANLPMAAAGSLIQLSWRLGSDDSVGRAGWYVDTVLLADGFTCCRSLVAPLIVNTRRAGPNIAFSYNALSGQTYIVQTTTALTNLTWVPLETNSGDGTLKSYTNTTSGAQQRFFRLQTQ